MCINPVKSVRTVRSVSSCNPGPVDAGRLVLEESSCGQPCLGIAQRLVNSGINLLELVNDVKNCKRVPVMQELMFLRSII